MATTVHIGEPLSRIDGIAKVTGAARYAAEHPADGLLHGFAVSGAIAKGRIAAIDGSAALAVPGVVEVVTHLNRPHVAWLDRSYQDDAGPPGSPLRPLYDDKIHFSGQPVALVVAESPEIARYAASLVAVDYESEPHNTDFDAGLADRREPRGSGAEDRGEAEGALESAPVRIDGDYRLAREYHNPIEMHASTAILEDGGRLTVYDKNQGSQNVQAYLASVFNLADGEVRVLNPFVGGAFGSGLRPHYQVYLAVLAARMLGRSVRVVMTRQQMFTHTHRPECLECVSLAADENGRLSAMMIDATTATSRLESYSESIVKWGATAYACENAKLDYAIAELDTATPGDMRAPGAATGMNLFEIAMDELAYAAGIDPLELRLVNYSDRDPLRDAPYTSKALMSAYTQGAARFGWDRRSPVPRSMREGRELVGWGVATGMWVAMMVEASARATFGSDGRLEIASATSDIGTGTYTIMAQIAADTLGLPVERVTVKLGDSRLPTAPIEGGSCTAASVGAAVQLACRSLAGKLHGLASAMAGSPLGSTALDGVEFADGSVRVKGDPSRAVAYDDILRASGQPSIAAEETARPGRSRRNGKSQYSHSAVFAEVRVDEELGVVRVPRIVCAAAAGRIINPKTAGSQLAGGIVMGLGMALQEETLTDHRIGRIMNHNLAEYHVPVNADVQEIEVIFVDEPDPEVSPLGVKGVGELGIVGTAAAIANAIFHATGKRIRELPITIDKLLG
ncbi:MAG: xanthine dehydrogenase family protein molybdopterin-binding subunit [Hyphomicrobiaceae bacterium]|nr:xanthine dehydrogenase family protein molybdopterin-binding subunit [Hyphomicrobiaceae bacterium]